MSADTDDDAYPAHWIRQPAAQSLPVAAPEVQPESEAVPEEPAALESQLDALSDGDLLKVLNRVLGKRQEG